MQMFPSLYGGGDRLTGRKVRGSERRVAGDIIRLMIVDSHTHLLRLKVSPEEAVREASEAGVGAVVNVGTTISDSRIGGRIADEIPGVYSTVGIHPHNAGSHTHENMEAISRLLESGRFVALGEVGLDYYRNEWPADAQRALFDDAVSLANEHRIPLVIHTREAFSDTMDALGAARVPVVLHCFEGGEGEVAEARERGYYIGLTGNITYKNSKTAAVIANLDPERLMVETDAPYLSPVPLRGKPNAPKNVVHTARFVAGKLGLDFEEFSALTTANARRFYGLDRDA